MPDLLTDDQTRAMFRQLRAEQLHHVVPPGAADAHRTVRRRRITSALAASVALLTIIGLGYAQLTAPTQLNPAEPSSAPGQDELIRLADQAHDSVRAAGPSASANILTGGWGPLNNDIQDEDGRGVPMAHYTLGYACRGVGQAKITWSIGKTTRTATMACGDPSPATSRKPDGTLTATGSGVMTIRIDPNIRAINHAAYAYSVATS